MTKQRKKQKKVSFYCVVCRKKYELDNYKHHIFKSGTAGLTTMCPKGHRVYRFVKKENM